MSLTLEKLKKAREAGYSDDEIISTASQKYPKIGNAIKSGYSIDEIADFYTTSPRAQAAAEQETISKLKEVPQAINRGEGLPVGGEPMVGGPDILALEPGQTKTFMEDEEGKPVEVRRAEAIGVTGKVIPEPISPDGMSYEQRAELIKQKEVETKSARLMSPISGAVYQEPAVAMELNDLRKKQVEHDGRYKNWLSQMIGGGEGVTPSGEKVQTQKRTGAAIKAVGDFRQQIDDIIVNDNFLEYAATKGITTPGFLQAKLGRIGIGSEAYNQELDKLKQNQDVRKLAEEWAMTTPGFSENVSDIFGRAWDGYAGAIGSGTVGPIGLALQEIGFENAGQSLVEAADYADQMRKLGQDPRKVSELAQFGRDVSSGLGFTGAAIVAGVLGNTARASLGLNSARAINLFQKGTTLGFGGLNSAWGGYSEARANGATDQQAKQAALFSALTQAPLELVSPLQKWVSRFDKVQQDKIYKGLNKAAQAVIEGTEEALFNEMPQQIAGNLVKKYVYEPNQDIFEGTVYAGGVGGAAGVMASIFTQMLGVKKTNQKQKQGDELGSELDDIDSEADKAVQELAPDPESALAAQMMEKSTEIDNLKEEIDNDEMGLQAFETGTPERQQADMALKAKKDNLAQLEGQFAKLSAAPAPATEAAPTEAAPETKEQINTRIEELNKEFDALDENDTAGQDRVNKAIFAEQNKLAEMTAIEQGVEPQATTPTREMGLPPSGRRTPFGTFYPDRPVLQAFVKATDKAIKGIRVAGKRAQKLKNAIRTNIARNAGFLAGINAEVISSEDYGKLTGGKQVAADSGTYRAAFFNGKKYLVLPDVNQLTATTIKEEQRAASKDAALDQESRAADKKLEEEMIHLSMYQALQDEFAALKKPKQTEQQYIVSRIGQIAQEVKRTNPNAVPGVSEAYLNRKGTLDDVGFSMEFMRMVIQRVRTGQITEDLNAIRKAEAEAFSDESRGTIIALKNSILNALKFVRNSLARYLGKGTSTKEVKRMEDSINAILDEYGIVKGEANYEFKDYSAAQPKGEVSLTITPTEEAAPAEPTEVIEEKADPNTEVESEVVDIENLADDATYEQIEEAAPATMVNLKASTKNVSGSFQQFSKILGDSFKSLVRFAQTIWKKIGLITVAIAGASVIASPIFVGSYMNLQGPEGRADLRPTGLIKDNQNIFKPYLKKTTVEELEKSLETPAETLDLIRNAINQAQPFVGNVDIDFNSIDQFADSIKPEEFPSGNTKRSYNYNPLLEISADDVKNAAQSLKALAKDKAKIEYRIRQVMGAMEFFTKRKFKDVKIIVRQTSPSEAATFMALGRAGGFPTSRAQYNPRENTIELQPQTLISLAEDGIVATSSASNIANELTHNLQYTTNNGQPLGILGIKLSDFDTASTFLTMQMPVYSKNGKLFQTINAESNWADILIGKYFGAKNNIQPKSIESVLAEQPKMQKVLQEKETTDFVDSIGYMSGMSSQEIIARAGVTPAAPTEAIEASAAATPQEQRFLSETTTVYEKKAGETYTSPVDKTRNSLADLTDQPLLHQTNLAGARSILAQMMGRNGRVRLFASNDKSLALGQSGKTITISLNPNKVNGIEPNSLQNRTLRETGSTSREYIVEKFIRGAVDKVEGTKESISKLKKEIPLLSRFKESEDGTILTRAEPTAPAEGEIVARAAYVQDFQVFDKNRENPIDDKIIVEVDSPAEVDQAVKNTEKYREWLRKSRAKKLKFFTVGSPRLKRGPGESGISARAGVTPRVVSEQRRITDKMIGEIESAIESIKPKRSRAGKEYVSRTTQKGKKYPSSLVSPYSAVVNLYTSDTATESLNAIKKIMQKNPNLDFLTMVTNIANQTENYGLNITEQANITAILLKLMPTFHQEVMESDSLKDRENIALNGLDIQYNLAQSVVNLAQAASRILNGAKMIRNIGNAGTAVAAYKKRVIDSLVGLQSILKYDFNEVANAVRGDRRKAVDNVFTLKEVLSKITQLKKKAERNPQAAVDSIRKMISRKKTRGTREIVLEFCASMFDTKGEKYSNMVVDETAKAIMSLGADKKEFSPDNVYKYIYQAFGAVAKQTAKELGAKEVPVTPKEAKKREGKYLAQVKSVIGNDKAYKQFIAELKTKIGSLYQDKAQFESDYKELFSMLGDRQWSEAMRNQAIKDSADFLDYKFNDLITYIGENRSAAQSAVKAHIRAELSNIGATNEQIDKFVDDVQTYLDNETAKKVKKSLGFEISKETGRIIGGKIEKEAMKKVATAEERFQLAKTLKGLTKLAATDQRAFLDKLNELIITELGFDEATSQELSKYIEEQMAKAIQAQKSENLQQAIKRAQETLANNGIKKKANQRTVIQRLIEMANMGQLDEFGVYEAFRQTHDFGKGYLEWNPELANQLREWGDRISALPEGVTRSIEEQKLGRFMLENQVFSAKDYFGSYWYFSLLSSVGTQSMNFLGGTFNLLGNMAVWSIYTKGKSTIPMLRALYSSLIRSEAPARNAFAYTMQTGLNPSGIQDEKMGKYPKVNVTEGANPQNTPKLIYNIITFGDGKINSAPDWVNNTLKNLSPKQFMRFMRAVDAFIRETTYEVRAASLGASAFRKNEYNIAKEQAIRELASSKSKGKEKEREIIIRANEIYSEQRLSEQKRVMAEQDALETIFGQEPQGLLGILANTANTILAKYTKAKYFIPFTNVVSSVLNNLLNYTPLVAAYRLKGNIELVPLLKGKIKLTQKGMHADFIKGREDKAAEVAIKGMIGFVATILPVLVDALQGEDEEEKRKFYQFYDAGPTDPELNKIWRDNGGIPYSLRIGNKYISYQYTPLVIPLASGARVQQWLDQQEKKEKKTPVDIVEKAATLILAPLGVGFVAALEQSFLTGVGDLLDLRNSQNIPKDTFKIATNIVSRMLVPGELRDLQKAIIDERVEGDNVASNLLKEMPGSSAFLDKSVGYFGDPARYNSIIEENGIGRRAFSLLGRIASSETPDPAFQIMYRNGLTPPKWQGSLNWSNDVRMTKAEQREFVGIAGPLMKEWIIDNEETLNDLPNDEAQEFLSNNIGQIRRSVKADLEFEKGIEVDLE